MLRVRRERERGPRRRRARRPGAAGGADLLDLHTDRTTTAACSRWSARTAPARRWPWPRSAALDLPDARRRPPPPRRRGRRAVRAARAAVDGRRRGGPRRLRRAGPPPSSACRASCYGPERSLPEVRRRAFADLAPDAGPPRAPSDRRRHAASAPATVLVAYNVWLAEPTWRWPARVAAAVRRPEVRALGLAVGERVQVSMNLIAPDCGRAGRGLRRRRRARRRSPAPSSSASCRAVLRRHPAGALGRARPGRRPHDRGAPGDGAALERWLRRWRCGGRPGPAGGGCGAAPARTARPRCRTSRRWPSAYSRQSSRTTQPRHTSLASRVDAPRSGKNRSGSTPRQLA